LNNKIAPIYLEFANSETALKAYLNMEASIRQGSLATREIEAIKLWVHSYKATQAGLDPEVQKVIRRSEVVGEERLDCIMNIARTLYTRAGKLPDELLSEARALGISDENLVDLTMVMSTIFFTNITNHINDSRSSLPPAPDIA